LGREVGTIREERQRYFIAAEIANERYNIQEHSSFFLKVSRKILFIGIL